MIKDDLLYSVSHSQADKSTRLKTDREKSLLKYKNYLLPENLKSRKMWNKMVQTLKVTTN